MKSPPQLGPSLRQWELLELLARGYENREIAEKMGVTLKTVENSINEIKVRLHARNRVELARWAYKQRPALLDH
jgi:two-component system response regulator NreC